MIDPKTIGQDKPIQNPQEAIERAEGTYTDAVEKMSPAEKASYVPSAPDPKPFTIRRTAGGG